MDRNTKILMFLIEKNTPKQTLEEQLNLSGWLNQSETILSIDKAGEGNMNVVLRITTNLRSFILKQSRTFVLKYPQVPAPIDRIDTEYHFYSTLSSRPIKKYLPSLINYAPHEYLIMMNDLGKVHDMTMYYNERHLPESDMAKLVHVLQQIHEAPVHDTYPKNLALRQLNHQHIFILPFIEDNGFRLDDVQPGLSELAKPYKHDEQLKKEIVRLGQLYLSEGTTLLHGDYYPGSWMSTDKKLFVIDPEFSFLGFREFDLGVMAGHLWMITDDEAIEEKLLQSYSIEVDKLLMSKIAGVEVMRRLIGLAQLPMERSLEEKEDLLKKAYEKIMG